MHDITHRKIFFKKVFVMMQGDHFFARRVGIPKNEVRAGGQFLQCSFARTQPKTLKAAVISIAYFLQDAHKIAFKDKPRQDKTMHKTRAIVFVLTLSTALGLVAMPFSAHSQEEKKPAQTAPKPAGITLQDALTAGIGANPEFGAAAAAKKAADQRVRQGEAGYYPSVDARGDAGYEHSDNVGTRAREPDGDITLFRNDVSLSLSQMLFDGFATQSLVEGEQASSLSSAHRLHATAELVGLSIIEAYLDVLRQRQLLLIAQKNIKEHQSILALVQDGVAAGRQTQADAEQVKARLAAARANEAVTIQSLRNAEAEYRRTVGEMPGELTLPKMPLENLAQDVEKQVEQALAESPTLRAAASDVDAARAQRDGTRAAFLPRVDLQMNARTGNDLGGVEGRNQSAAALVVMNWNLYRGGADTARQREFEHRHQQTKSQKDTQIRNLENDVRQTWASMVSSGERAEQFRAQAKSNEGVVAAYKDQFSLDRRTLLDVLDSQNELVSTRANTVNTEFLEMFAVYRLLALTGNLLPILGVAYPEIDANLADADTETTVP